MRDEERLKLRSGPYYPPKTRRGRRRGPPLPDESLLGTRTDKELGALWGIPWKRVAERRHRLGIPSFRRQQRWLISPATLRAIREQRGLMLSKVGVEAGVSGSYYGQIEAGYERTITRGTAERIAAALICRVEDFAAPVQPDTGRAAGRPVPNDSLLGTQPDAKLAMKWWLSTHVVRQRRLELGIASFQCCRQRPMDDTLLGKRPDYKLAKLWGVNPERVRRRREELGIPGYAAQHWLRPIQDESLLGTQSDAKLAKLWGVSVDRIRRRREELGIASWLAQRVRPLPDDSLLGKQPDADLAAAWGVGVERIRRRRRELGIPTFEGSQSLAVSAAKLRDCRVKANLTRKQVVARSGLSRSYYGGMESGALRTMSRETAERYAAILNCTVEDFATPLIPPAQRVEPESHGTERL